MNFFTVPARCTRFIAHGSLLIGVFAGSACARDMRAEEQSGRGDDQRVAQYPQLTAESHSKAMPSEPETNDHHELEASAGSQNPDSGHLQSDLDESKARLDEIIELYRRLHIELDDAGRSSLIVELFNDPRLAVRRLGFELTDRDLSSNTVLSAQVSEAAAGMLDDPDAEVRSKAARLITRLVPPDAMIVLTRALAREDDPVAAEPMLMGIARWPSPEAVDPVLRWFMRDDGAFAATSSAVWAIEQAGFWDTALEHPLLLARLRAVDPGVLQEPAMKLLARIGDASDLRMLLLLVLGEVQNQQQWAANALVETPRAVEILVQAAEENDRLFQAASDSLIRHRATPEGLRRLVTLPYADEKARTQAIVRMGEAMENDRLVQAVRLAGLDSAHSVLLLNRLINGNIEITPQVGKGIILLAQIELEELRPNRAFEAAIALEGAPLDSGDRTKIITIKVAALILLGKLDEAWAISKDVELWINTIEQAGDPELGKRIGQFVLEMGGDTITADQRARIEAQAGLELDPVQDTDSVNEPKGESSEADQGSSQSGEEKDNPEPSSEPAPKPPEDGS